MPSIPCFICHQTYFESKKHEEEDIHFFKTPAHKLESWRKKLNNIHLLANSHLCHVISKKSTLINSQDLEKNAANYLLMLNLHYYCVKQIKEIMQILKMNQSKQTPGKVEQHLDRKQVLFILLNII